MLIVAIPKSASTSLMDTLGNLHNKKSLQNNDIFINYPISTEFKFIHKYHRDMREIDENLVKTFGGDTIYKQHILPTTNNKLLLKNTKKVILLRIPRTIVYAYRRERNKFKDAYLRREFKSSNTEAQWLNKSKEIGLLDDLVKFNQEWKRDDSDKLIIYYDDLVKKPKEEINKIEKYFGLPESKKITLSKKRYTR